MSLPMPEEAVILEKCFLREKITQITTAFRIDSFNIFFCKIWNIKLVYVKPYELAVFYVF